jgi:hypothetical protein
MAKETESCYGSGRLRRTAKTFVEKWPTENKTKQITGIVISW